jgi:hypothetical protein
MQVWFTKSACFIKMKPAFYQNQPVFYQNAGLVHKISLFFYQKPTFSGYSSLLFRLKSQAAFMLS